MRTDGGRGTTAGLIVTAQLSAPNADVIVLGLSLPAPWNKKYPKGRGESGKRRRPAR